MPYFAFELISKAVILFIFNGGSFFNRISKNLPDRAKHLLSLRGKAIEKSYYGTRHQIQQNVPWVCQKLLHAENQRIMEKVQVVDDKPRHCLHVCLLL